MENLPPEVIVLILLLLRVEDALSLSAVSRTLRRAVTSCSRYWMRLTPVGHSPQTLMSIANCKSQWDAFLSYCRQMIEVKRMFAVDRKRIPRVEHQKKHTWIDKTVLAQEADAARTTPLAGASCLVSGLRRGVLCGNCMAGKDPNTLPADSYGMVCYRTTSEGAVQKAWSLGDVSESVLFATDPIAPFLVVLTRASRGVILEWIDVTSGVTLWKSQLDLSLKLGKDPYSNTTRRTHGAMLHYDKYPNHSVLCPHCGLAIRSQSDARGQGIAIIFVPDIRGEAHQFASHTSACHIVEPDQHLPPLNDCLVVLVKASLPVSGVIDANPPKPCKGHELVTYCSSEGGKCSVIRSVIRYDDEAKRFQYHILSVAPSPASAKLDMVAITTSPPFLVALDAVDSEVHEHVHLQASVFDVETMECVRSMTLEHEFIRRRSLFGHVGDISVSIHLCTASFLVLFAGDSGSRGAKCMCFSLATRKCVGQLELPYYSYAGHAVVMNRALFESPVHVGEDQLYKLPLLAILTILHGGAYGRADVYLNM